MEPLDWKKAGFEPGRPPMMPLVGKRELPPNYQAIERAPKDAEADEPYLWPLDAGIPNANLMTPQEEVATVNAMLAQGSDMVNLPPHYARFPIEPIRFIAENKLDWFQGNIVKYVLRHDAKNGMEDIAKVIRYAAMYKLFLLKDPDWWKAGKPEDFKP